MPDRQMLEEVFVDGWKTLYGQGGKLTLGSVNVLLGANGAGKSNLVSFFQMLEHMMRGELHSFLAGQGFAERVLPHGGKKSSEISTRLVFRGAEFTHAYELILARDTTEGFIIKDERILCLKDGETKPSEVRLGGGSKESALSEKEGLDKTCQPVRSLLSSCRAYSFHDAAPAAKFRTYGYKFDNQYLHSDGGNLAAFLRRLAMVDKWRPHYSAIVQNAGLVAPMFENFAIGESAENEDNVRLNWKETDSDYLFSPSQLSDGAIRFIALATLFLQPPELRPAIIVVDEPELGLHPRAKSSLAKMVKAAGTTSQIILATQSPQLFDEFESESIIVVERNPGEASSTFRRGTKQQLRQWCDTYF